MRQRDDKKERAICDAAIKLIVETGFAETSMSKIAREANVSAATIYVYFTNKEDLLNKLYAKVKREMAAELLKGIKPESTVKDAFRISWNNFYEYAAGNPVRFAFTEQFANSPLVGNICREETEEYFAPLKNIIERGKKQKVLKNISADMFYAFTFAPLTGLLKQHIAGEITLDRKMLTGARDIAWDAVTR